MTEKTEEQKEERAHRWIPRTSELRYLKRFHEWAKAELPGHSRHFSERYVQEYAEKGADPVAQKERAESVAAPQFNGHSEDPLEKRLYRNNRARRLYSEDSSDG